MNVQSGWLLPTGQTRADTRLTALGATTPADPVTVHSGILPGSYDGTFTVSGFWLQGLSAMTGRVSEGRAVIQGTITQGAYPLAMPTSTDLTFTDGDPQYDRIDLVVLRVYDNAYDGSGRTETTCEIIEGTPAATPTAPATPDLALPLYQVTVPATASAGNGGIPWTTALTDQRTTTVAIGGILPAYGTTANGAYLGQYRDLNGTLQRWDGTTWQDYQPPVEVESTSSGAVAASGFSVLSFYARRTHGVCTFALYLLRSGADITSNSAGNITDLPVGTLPSGWTPPFDIECVASDGFASGACRITASGDLLLRTWSGNAVLATGHNLRVAGTYVM
ncbi:hypothetical protein ACL02U_06280 [Streptomyces sp. MS06]|uniref:hypothetical protein n=1 Tax=Streptomyces sp. MS06 TaxID=3385974 RepID=UPI0039A3BD88